MIDVNDNNDRDLSRTQNITPASSTPATTLTKEQLLQHIMSGVQKVNFREKAGVDSDARITPTAYKVIAINEVLKIAAEMGFNLCKKNDICYAFNGAYWVSLHPDDDMKLFFGDCVLKMGVPFVTAHNVDFRKQLYEQFLSAATLRTQEVDPNIILINLKNGTFEFTRDGFRLREFRPEDFLTYQLPFPYDPEAVAPMFEAYLNRVLPSRECQMQLQEYSGYLFSKGLKLEKVLLLYGTGANGKSVFFEILTALLGSENCCSYSLQMLASANNAYYRAQLENKLVNYASEVSNKFDTGILKQIASGEPIEARHPYGRPFMLKNYAKLIFNVNELPYGVEHTKGFFRRFLVIPFSVTIPEDEQDVMLAPNIITHELPGVLNWALEGLTRIVQQKCFTESVASNAAIKEYETDSNSVALFIDEMGYQASDEAVISLHALFKEYQNFCKNDGYRAVSKKVFARRLKHLKIEFIRRNAGMFVCVEKRPNNPEGSEGGVASVDQ